MPPSPDASIPDERAIERLLLRVVAAVIAVLIAGAFLALQRGDEPATGGPGGAGSGTASGIGPLPGAQLASYARDRQEALASADGAHGAVVSFGRYVTAEVARRAVAPLRPLAYLVAAPGGSPSTVVDVDAWAKEETAAARAEKAELERLLASATVDQPDFVAQYRADIARLDRLIALADPKGEMVFAVALQGRAQELRDVALNPSVRIVDIGGPPPLPPMTHVRGLRPEETVTAQQPPARPQS